MKVKKLNEKSGFTLLEVIVVVIIVGILAAAAMPKLFNTVTISNAAEGEAVVGTLAKQAIICLTRKQVSDFTSACNTFAEVSDSSSAPTSTSGFTYTITGTPGATIVFTATHSSGSSNTIVATATAATNSHAIVKNGVFNS